LATLECVILETWHINLNVVCKVEILFNSQPDGCTLVFLLKVFLYCSTWWWPLFRWKYVVPNDN